MTLEDLSYVSQIVGVVAIFASLVFVGLQIRQNTLATRAASHNASRTHSARSIACLPRTRT